MSQRTVSINRVFVQAVIVAAVVLIAYIPALRGGYIWDDDRYVTKNITLRDSAGLRRIWFDIGATPQYYPLVFTSFWIERRIWDGHPAGYHLTNVLLHAVNAVLVLVALRSLKIPGAWIAAMVWKPFVNARPRARLIPMIPRRDCCCALSSKLQSVRRVAREGRF